MFSKASLDLGLDDLTSFFSAPDASLGNPVSLMSRMRNDATYFKFTLALALALESTWSGSADILHAPVPVVSCFGRWIRFLNANLEKMKCQE